MIEITNGRLDDSVIESLNELVEKDIDPQEAFKLLKIIKDIDLIIIQKQTQHNQIIQKYGEVSQEEPDQIEIKKENVEDFKKEIQDLMDVKHQLDFEKINYNDLKLTENIKIKTLARLDFLFKGL